jgi:hypothetical protein
MARSIELLDLFLVAAALGAAAEPEPRAGVWETRIGSVGKTESLRLILRFNAGQSTDVQGVMYRALEFDGHTSWMMVSDCGYFRIFRENIIGHRRAYRCGRPEIRFDGSSGPSYTLIKEC